MSSRFILMAGIASLCIGLTGPSFAAGAEAELTAAATGVQQVAMANDAKEKPAKKKRRVLQTRVLRRRSVLTATTSTRAIRRSLLPSLAMKQGRSSSILRNISFISLKARRQPAVTALRLVKLVLSSRELQLSAQSANGHAGFRPKK